MRLYRQGHLFIFECRYDERKTPKDARFWWNPEERRWETSSTNCAIKLIRYASPEARRWLEATTDARPSFSKLKAGSRLKQMQAKAHETHPPAVYPESPGWMRLPVRDLEGLEALSEKYRDSINEGRRFASRLGE